MSKILYVLNLDQNKYYVGITDDFEKRLYQHKIGVGSEWTKTYKYLSTRENKQISNDIAEHEETKLTCKLMLKLGINNVRGAQFCKVEPFTEKDTDILVGTIGHVLKISYRDIKTKIISMLEDEDEDEDELYPKGSCYRCGRNNHYAYNCYARTNIHGYTIF